ncbi:MAG TPA: HEAT repeat domain-containing protein [Sumerlaeia bacterium]|nr:HEAT repeat domain-containing protein [Sumerlaeia bacterium]
MIARTMDCAELSPVKRNGPAVRSWVGNGALWLARGGGKAAGCSVRAMQKTSGAVVGIGRRAAEAAREPGKRLANALRTPTTDLIPTKVTVGARLRTRRRIRRLQKEIDLLRKRMAPKLASALMEGLANPAEDEQVGQCLAGIRTREREIGDLKRKLAQEEARKEAPVLSKRARGEVQPTRATPAPAGIEPHAPAAKTAVAAPQERADETRVAGRPEAVGKPWVLPEKGAPPGETRVDAKPRTGIVAPTPSVEAMQAPSARAGEKPGRVGISAETPERGKTTEATLRQEMLGDAQFSLASERLAFEDAVRATSDEDPAVREAAVRSLAWMKNPAATRVLILLTEDPRQSVRTRSLEALLGRQETGLLPVFASATKDRSARVRLAALRGLYKLDEVNATPYLIEALADPDARVRRRAAMCLAWAGAHEAAPKLVSMLDDPDAAVRKAVIDALEAVRSKLAVGRLIEMLDAEDIEAREAAHRVLKSLTGQHIVFSAGASADTRAKGQARWRAWWEANRASFSIR